MAQMFKGALKGGLTVNPYVKLKRQNAWVHDIISPDQPDVPVTPGPPTVDQSLIDREAQDTIRRRRGRAANVVAGDAAVPGASLAVNTLLGGG